MNTEELQAKSLFMAQHLGQKVSYGERRWTLVYSYRGEDKDKTIDLETAIGIGCALELRSVSDLTDEECMKIQAFRGWNSMLNDAGNANATRRWLADIDGNFHERTFTTSLIISDYLRSIGILIPFTYLTETGSITLSTEEIIKRGWAQLVKSKDNGQ